MECMITNEAKLDLLRRANSCFNKFFARFSGAPIFGTDEEVEALLRVEATLQSVRALLDGRVQNSQDAAVREELAEYRHNLLRLRTQLGTMQHAALECQTLLHARREHLHAAKSWCNLARGAD